MKLQVRLRQEAKVAGACRHANIAEVASTDLIGPTHFVVFEDLGDTDLCAMANA